MKKMKIAVVSEKEEVIQNIKSQFESLPGYNLIIETIELEGAKERISDFNPFITIVDVSQKLEMSFELIAEIARDISQTYLACVASKSYQDLIIRAIRAGAVDFLKFPADSTELESLILRAKGKYPHDAIPSKQGKIITVFSNKGGAGTTSLTINLGVGLAKFTKSKVVILDLVFQHGDVCSFLDVIPGYTINDLTENFDRLDKAFFQKALTQHPSGVHILSGSVNFEDSEVITGRQISYILNMLREMFDYVVIDAGDEFNEPTLTALDLSDYILLVSLLNIPSIQNTKRCLDIFRRLRYDDEKVKLIINRYNSKNYECKIDIEQARKALDYKIFWMLPNDYSTLIKSINQGEPILYVNKKSDISASLSNLIKTLTNGAYVPETLSSTKNIYQKIADKFLRIIEKVK